MIDLHCHILPGLDDGADNWGQSLEMASIAAMDGISGIVCTPHCSPAFPGNDRKGIMAAVEQLRTRLRQAKIVLDIYPGCELAIDANLPEKINSGELLTINDNRKIALIEMPPEVIPPNLGRFFWTLRTRGVNTVLAHPERNYFLMKNPSVLLEWVREGVMVQITAASLMGLFGQGIRDFSLRLLRHRMVHFVATDSHSSCQRAPGLSEAHEIAQTVVGLEETYRIFHEYPAQVLLGELPDTAPPVPFENKPSFIRRLFPFR